MKTITTILLLLSFIGLKAQEKFSVGITLEGVHSSPKNLYVYPTKIAPEFGGGIGAFFSATIWKSFLANTGLNYMYIQYDEFDKNIIYQVGQTTFDGYRYKQNYLVVPINLRKSFFNGWLFIEPGVELNWILGRPDKTPKNELLWKIGAGSKIGKLNYSLNYLWGNKEQDDMLVDGAKYSPVIYKSRMVQFKVSYPLWGSKK